MSSERSRKSTDSMCRSSSRNVSGSSGVVASSAALKKRRCIGRRLDRVALVDSADPDHLDVAVAAKQSDCFGDVAFSLDVRSKRDDDIDLVLVWHMVPW